MGEEGEKPELSETDEMWKTIDPAMQQVKRLRDLNGQAAEQKEKVVANKEQRRHKYYRHLTEKK